MSLTPRDPYQRWVATSVIRGSANGAVSAVAYAALGDVTAAQFRALASIQRELGADVRLSNRQNVVFRGLTEAQLPVLYARLEAIGMARPGAELARDVVACPGADTCNIAVTQSRGLAKAIGEQLEEEGLAEVGGVRINISGCTNSCGQHHASDIGFFGAERRAHGRAAPGYQMLLGGYVGQEQIHFGDKALRLPAKAAPEAAVRVVRRFADERSAGETFRGWMDRAGGAIGRRRGPARISTSSRLPTKPPSTTPTSTRPARSWPKSASRSARPEPSLRRGRGGDRRRQRRRPDHRRRARPRGPARPRCTANWPWSGSNGSSTIRTSRCCSPPGPITCVGGSCRAPTIRQGRAGYLRWRRDQKARHAADVAAILSPCGYSPDEIERVQQLIRREAIDGTSAVEDAACLVFIETQLAGLTERMDHDLLVDVIRKTARKMSPEALGFVADIPLGDQARNVLTEALQNGSNDLRRNH